MNELILRPFMEEDMDIKDTYSVDYLIGEKDYIGKGFGKRLVEALAKKVWECAKARQIVVQPESENDASRRTLGSAGYLYNEKNDVYYMKRV